MKVIEHLSDGKPTAIFSLCAGDLSARVDNPVIELEPGVQVDILSEPGNAEVSRTAQGGTRISVAGSFNAGPDAGFRTLLGTRKYQLGPPIITFALGGVLTRQIDGRAKAITFWSDGAARSMNVSFGNHTLSSNPINPPPLG